MGGEGSRELEEVSRVDVIVDGLLEVEAIGADLGFGLLQDNLPSSVPPAAGLADLRTEKAYREERRSFA